MSNTNINTNTNTNTDTVPNVFETDISNVLNDKTIVIRSNFGFGQQFLTKNIRNLLLSIRGNEDESTHRNNQYLVDRKYEIIVGGSTIYTGLISTDNIFPSHPVNLNLLKYSKVMIVIYDVVLPSSNYKLCANVIESNVDLEGTDTQFLRWAPYDYMFPKNGDKDNHFKIISGMCGCTYNYLIYPKEYLNKTMSTIELRNKIKVCKINHLDSNYNINVFGQIFHNEYSLSRQISLLTSTKSDVIMESIKKSRNVSGKNKTTFILGSCDGIANIKILCDNKKVFLKSINLLIDDSSNKNVDFTPTNFGYSVNGFEFDDHHLLCVANEILIDLDFELIDQTEFLSIAYDRCIYNWSLRKHCAQIGCDIIDIGAYRDNSSPINIGDYCNIID